MFRPSSLVGKPAGPHESPESDREREEREREGHRCPRTIAAGTGGGAAAPLGLRREAEALVADRLAAEARANPKLWGAFWEFVEAFAPVRHAYAITSHRAQGSTYIRAFVSWRDILLNPNRAESMRCLYVAASRPKKELYLG